MPAQVSVTIVTFNSGRYLERCLESVFLQRVPLEVIVVENASEDSTREILDRYVPHVRVIHNITNVGFAAAQNQAIAASSGTWVLVLNPDAILTPNFLSHLIHHAASANGSRIGTLCGRMLALGRDLRRLDPPLLDTTGIYFTPAMRHFDRGWRQPDDGRFRDPEFVFGASAAAALYRREMVDDLSENGEFFDPDFFAYREDADVAWRAQLLGWQCLYVPDAIGYHVRRVGPINRRHVGRLINMHSVKNRFLMRIKNLTPGLFQRFWLSITARDLLVVAACVLWEQGSLPALWHTVRCLPRALQRRRWIMSRRVAPDAELVQWWIAGNSEHTAPAQPVSLEVTL